MTSWKDRDRFGMRARPTHQPKAPPPPPPPPPAVGARVARGPDWMWGDHDGGAAGSVVSVVEDAKGGAWVHVQWDGGAKYAYRWNVDGKFDLTAAPPTPAEGVAPTADAPSVAALSAHITEVHAYKADEDEALAPVRPSRLLPGTRVVRGPDWKWQDQDGGGPGTVLSTAEANLIEATEFDADDDDLWVYVRWDADEKINAYRWGFDDAYDLTPVTAPTASTEPAPAKLAEAGAVCEVSTHQEHFSFNPTPTPEARESKLRDLTQQLSHVFDAFDVAKERSAEPFVLAAHYKVAVREIESLTLKIGAVLDAEDPAEVP